MAKTSELEALFRATTYRIFLPDTMCELRIDQPCEALRNWLRGESIESFAVITACNPGSQRLSANENAERQAQLECDLLEGNYEPYAAENVADSGDWPTEESCFVPDLLPEDACALGEDYGQNAVLVGGADGIPHLLWIAAEHG